MNKKELKKNVVPYVTLLGIILVLLYVFNFMGNKVNDLTFDTFMKNVNEGKVEKVEVTPSNNGGVYYITGKLDGYDKKETFKVTAPLSEEVVQKLVDGYEKYDYEIKVFKDPSSNAILSILSSFLPIIILGGFAF